MVLTEVEMQHPHSGAQFQVAVKILQGKTISVVVHRSANGAEIFCLHFPLKIIHKMHKVCHLLHQTQNAFSQKYEH